MDMTRLKSDSCVFTNKDRTLIILMYVDDLLIMGQDSERARFIDKLRREKFTLKHITTLTTPTSLTFVGKETKLNKDNTIDVKYTDDYYNSIFNLTELGPNSNALSTTGTEPPLLKGDEEPTTDNTAEDI